MVDDVAVNPNPEASDRNPEPGTPLFADYFVVLLKIVNLALIRFREFLRLYTRLKCSCFGKMLRDVKSRSGCDSSDVKLPDESCDRKDFLLETI